MAISDGLGIQALVQSYDKKAVSQAFAEIAKDFNKSADELNNEINKIKIDKDVMNNLVNQIKALPEEVRKKTQGMSFDLFSDLINADGVEEKIDEAMKTFSTKMQSFVKLRDQIGNDKIIIETDLEDLNKLTDKMREVIELQSQIKGMKKSQKRTGLEDDLKSAQNEINTWTQARQQLEKYEGSLEEVKDTIAKLANKFRDNKLGSFNLIEEKNIEQIKEMVGLLERYVQLSGDEKLSGLKDFGIKGGVIDLKQLYRGDINANSSDLRKQYQEYADVVKKYISLNKSIGSGGGGTGDSFGFGASKEEAEELLNIIKEIRNILNEIKDNRSILDSENILSSDKIDEISSRFNEIASNFGDDLVASVDDFTNSLKEVDNIDWSFDNLKNSLLDIVTQFQNSLASVNLSSTQLDEAYKMIKGWNDADSYSVTRGKATSHERGAFLNSKTGTVSNSYFIDAEKSFGVQLFNALEKLSVGLNGEISSLYDTFIHSHPFRTAIDNLKTTGSDIGFSYSDLDIAINKFLKEKVNNMMVTSNYKYANLDLSGIEKTIANELLKHFRSELVKSGLEIDNNNRIVFPKDLATNSGVFDFDQKSNIVNGALKQALKNVGLDENRFTTGNIEDLKIDISQLESQGEETNGTFQELLDVLRNISNVLTEINTKGFKFDTVEQLNNTNQNKLQSEFKESNSEAENLLNTLNEIQSEIDLIQNSSKLSNVLNFDDSNKFNDFNEKYRTVFTILSEYKQTILEINNLKLQPQTEETQKKIEELSLLAVRLGEQFQNIAYLNDVNKNDVIKRYGFSEEDFKIYSGDFIKIDKDALQHSLLKQLDDVFNELQNKFPDLYNDIMSGNIKIDANINPLSSITDELERIKTAGKSTFDSINVDLMNSKDYVEDLRSALNRIVDSNNGKGSKDGLDGYYAIKHRPELEQFKDITTMLPEEKFNKFLSTLEKAQPYLDSIVYKVKEVKEDTVEINNDVKHPKIEDKSGDMQQQDSSSILSEQQTLNNLEQAIKSVTIAIAEKNKAIQAEEVQMDLSINQEIKKLEELKGKLNEIKTEFEQGIASGLFKSKTNTDGESNGSNDGNTQSIELVPLIDDNQWMDAVDDIITKIGTKKINIEPDMTSEEWNTLKNYIDNISKQVINMKFVNGDSALPSDLSTSYTNSTKYVTELYKIEEKIARAKENNNKRELENLTTLEAEKKKFEDLLKLEEQFRANDRFKDFDTTVKDNNLNKLISTKEQEYQANRVAAETSLTNKLPSIEEEAYKVNESFNNTKSLGKVNSLLDEQKKKWQEIQDIRIQMETLDLNDSANKDQNKTEYENLDAQKKYLEEEKKLIDDELKQYDSLIDKATELKQIRELDKITSNADSQINGDRISNISNAYNEAVRINNALNNTETTLENLKNTIRDVRNQTSNEIFGNALKNAEQDAEELKNQLISGQISLSQYNSAIRNIQKDVSAQKDAVGFIDVDDIDQAREALTNYAREVTNGTIENVQWNASTSTLTGSFVNENKEVQKVTASIKQLSTGSQVATVSFGKAEKQVTSFSKFIDELGAKFRNLSTYLLSFVGFYEVWGAIQQGVTYVRELDTALTEMRKVSDETVDSLREFQEESFDIADSVGATAKTIQNSTADFMRLGESMEEAAKSAEAANILLNVSEFEDISSATDALISMSQAYTEFEKMEIIDKLNNIGNLYSISTDGIATALQDSASALTTAGNSIDEAIALVTAGNAIVQDPNSVGSGKLMPEHIVICGYLFYKC